MANQLPNWVYDMIIDLSAWSDDHPVLYQSQGLKDFVKTDTCGCAALEHVPAEVLAQAKAIRGYLTAPAARIAEGTDTS